MEGHPPLKVCPVMGIFFPLVKVLPPGLVLTKLNSPENLHATVKRMDGRALGVLRE